jgi:hypothetical protein
VTVVLMLVAALLTTILDTASQSFQLLLSIGAGTGLLYLARWFWWRVNAWSEVAAMASSFIVALGLFLARRGGVAMEDPTPLLITVGVTSVVWIATTFATKPVNREQLIAFYTLVRPGGPGWRDIRAASGVAAAPDSLAHALMGWVAGCTFVYSALFGTGSYIYGQTAQALVWTVVFVVSGAVLVRTIGFRNTGSPGTT